MCVAVLYLQDGAFFFFEGKPNAVSHEWIQLNKVDCLLRFAEQAVYCTVVAHPIVSQNEMHSDDFKTVT